MKISFASIKVSLSTSELIVCKIQNINLSRKVSCDYIFSGNQELVFDIEWLDKEE